MNQSCIFNSLKNSFKTVFNRQYKTSCQLTELSARKWLKHGYLQFVDYSGYEDPPHKDNTPDDWAKEAWASMVSDGVFDGSRPQAPLTRQEAALVLGRQKGAADGV